MKTKSLMVAVAVGMLASLPAYAFPSFNYATYASRFRPAQPAPSTVAKAQTPASQAKPEMQVAVMGKAPSSWHGAAPRACATHSH